MIFVVEDDKDIRSLITYQLNKAGYQILEFESAETALTALKKQECELMILDWMLPGMSGVELLKILNAQANRPQVLMLTARTSAADEVQGLELGADDYLSKPFDSKVLVARVKNLLKRVSQKKIFQLENLTYDFNSCVLKIDSVEVSLTPSERKVIETLMAVPGKVCSREQLVSIIQGDGVHVTDRTIDTHMVALRKKMHGWRIGLETVRGAGYRLGIGKAP